MQSGHAISLAAAMAAVLSTASAADPIELTLWRHHEAGDAELAANRAAIERFNASQDAWTITFEVLPQRSYTEAIAAAALAGQLPCLFDMDHPTVPNFAWSGHVRPLGPHLPDPLLTQLGRGALGRYNGEIYAVGQYDVALALFARRSVFERLGIRPATLDAPYDRDAFQSVLDTLEDSGEFEFALDVKTGYDGEWWSYAFGPWLQSFGGDLIDRGTYLDAEGVANGEAAVAFGQWFQSLFEDGYAARSPSDDQGFIQGRVGLDYSGSWSAPDYAQAHGDDLLIMPVPDFGHGPTIGAASWQWGISATCPHPDGAAEFIRFLMTPEEIAAMSDATGLMPVTEAAAALTERYRDGGPWRMFYDFSRQQAKVRPETPAYPVITSSFERALKHIRDGGEVQAALDEMVDTVERDIARNGGYGFGR